MSEICYLKVSVSRTEERLEEVEYIGVFQRSRVIAPDPFIGGHTGGTVAHPVVVIKRNGLLEDVLIDRIVFKVIEYTPSDFNIGEYKQLKRDGFTDKEVAKYFDLSTSKLYRLKKKYNLGVKKGGE